MRSGPDRSFPSFLRYLTPPIAACTQKCGCWNQCVIEDDFVEVMSTVDCDNGSDVDIRVGKVD